MGQVFILSINLTLCGEVANGFLTDVCSKYQNWKERGLSKGRGAVTLRKGTKEAIFEAHNNS